MKVKVFQLLFTINGEVNYWQWEPFYQGRYAECLRVLALNDCLETAALYQIQEVGL